MITHGLPAGLRDSVRIAISRDVVQQVSTQDFDSCNMGSSPIISVYTRNLICLLGRKSISLRSSEKLSTIEFVETYCMEEPIGFSFRGCWLLCSIVGNAIYIRGFKSHHST